MHCPPLFLQWCNACHAALQRTGEALHCCPWCYVLLHLEQHSEHPPSFQAWNEPHTCMHCYDGATHTHIGAAHPASGFGPSPFSACAHPAADQAFMLHVAYSAVMKQQHTLCSPCLFILSSADKHSAPSFHFPCAWKTAHHLQPFYSALLLAPFTAVGARTMIYDGDHSCAPTAALTACHTVPPHCSPTVLHVCTLHHVPLQPRSSYNGGYNGGCNGAAQLLRCVHHNSLQSTITSLTAAHPGCRRGRLSAASYVPQPHGPS